MAIHILPPQLANQIAAGEVVERPASVVKELVENSLDAGATRIQIDIENGGASLIRIRDNGIGIDKAELGLALARHATSKIQSLEDLEAILSLGFRGEALASISSVSRLTLTSRTENQNEAWQVYAQGREMETTIQPTSHPVGTTVEVANLFFNTPARRKFLRTDKTEFSHIDEVVRRIALAKPHIAFNLTHNGKTIRQYKSAVDFSQKLKRVAAICGEDFVQNALHLDWKHEELHLSGWVALPQFYRPQNDLAYCYVNGRIVRDKVINHAIRQAYSDFLSTEQYPAFVLFLDLNPNDVDVNVHPTKHEVRFQQSRLIHDFIYQGISNALQSEPENQLKANINETLPTGVINEPSPLWHSPTEPNRVAAGQNIFSKPYIEKQQHFKPHLQDKISKTEQKLYTELVQNTPSSTQMIEANSPIFDDIQSTSHLRALSLIEHNALLLQQNQQLFLLSITTLQHLKVRLTLRQTHIAQQALLIPLALTLDQTQLVHWQQQKQFFLDAGFQVDEHLAQQRIHLNSVPVCLRQQNLQKCIINLISQSIEDFTQFLTALCQHLDFPMLYSFSEAVNLLQETEQLLAQQSQLKLEQFLIKIDLAPYLTQI